MRTRPRWRATLAAFATLPVLLVVTGPPVLADDPPPTTTPPHPQPGPQPSGPAEFSRAAMNAAERAALPEAVGEVTRAGKVGNITAWPGDIVLPAGATPEAPTAGASLADDQAAIVAASARAPSPRAVAAAMQASTTVLHGPNTRTHDSSLWNDWRGVVAVQENQSDEVRAYAKSHLFDIRDNTLVTGDHNMDLLRATDFDWDSAGDGCGPYPSGVACEYNKDPAGAQVKDYYALGQYRHKCVSATYNCNNSWTTLTNIWKWKDPANPGLLQVGLTCSYVWDVLYGSRTDLACQST